MVLALILTGSTLVVQKDLVQELIAYHIVHCGRRARLYLGREKNQEAAEESIGMHQGYMINELSIQMYRNSYSRTA